MKFSFFLVSVFFALFSSSRTMPIKMLLRLVDTTMRVNTEFTTMLGVRSRSNSVPTIKRQQLGSCRDNLCESGFMTSLHNTWHAEKSCARKLIPYSPLFFITPAIKIRAEKDPKQASCRSRSPSRQTDVTRDSDQSVVEMGTGIYFVDRLDHDRKPSMCLVNTRKRLENSNAFTVVHGRQCHDGNNSQRVS